MKRRIADGSVGFPHVRVGHRQALIQNPEVLTRLGVFYCLKVAGRIAIRKRPAITP